MRAMHEWLMVGSVALVAGSWSVPVLGQEDPSEPTPARRLSTPASSVGAEPDPTYEAAGTRLEQGSMLGFMGWGVNVPVGSVRSFAANTSFLGFEAQFRYWLSPNLSLGASGEWATFVDEQPRTTYEIDNVAVTATSYNHIQTSSARFLVHYYPIVAGSFLPYIGPHVGVGWSMFELEAADLAISDSESSIAVGLEGGAAFPLGERGPTLLVNIRYSFLPTAEFRRAVDNMQTVGMLVGVGF